MCRKHCCLRNSDERLSYNDILENIQLQNPLFLNMMDPSNNGAQSSNADDQKSIGIGSEELNNVSVIETYVKKRKLFRSKSSKEQTNYKYKACCICLYDYRNGDKLRKLKCNHYFHQKCIDVWFERKTHCPLCKQSVISAKILSKRSNSSVVSLDISSSSTTSSANNTSSSFASSSTESEEEKECVVDVRKEQKYSLSDSHCSHKPTTTAKESMMLSNKYISDDSSFSTTRHCNASNRMVARHRKHFSHSQSQSTSSLKGELVMMHHPNDSNNHSSLNPFAVTSTAPTMSMNDVSLSSSPTNDISQHNDGYNSKSFLPLTPNINLFFDKSPSNHKQE